MRRLAPGVALGIVVALSACERAPASRPQPVELETVEVGAAPDAALTTELDERERRATAGGLAGALPDGFPADVAIFRPASLVDLAEGGGRVVAAFDSPAERATIERHFRSKLRAAGWVDGGGGVWSRGERRIRIEVDARPSGSRFSIDYEPTPQ